MAFYPQAQTTQERVGPPRGDQRERDPQDPEHHQNPTFEGYLRTPQGGCFGR